MDAKEFLRLIDSDAIAHAIQQAEQNTTGRIHVFVSRKKPKDAVRTAQRRFMRMRMDDSGARNAVLIYIAPRCQKFACIGDRAFNERSGEIFWRELVREMSTFFRKANYTEGLLLAIRRTGAIYAEHFSASAGKTS